jgi:hypothetical protein
METRWGVKLHVKAILSLRDTREALEVFSDSHRLDGYRLRKDPSHHPDYDALPFDAMKLDRLNIPRYL